MEDKNKDEKFCVWLVIICAVCFVDCKYDSFVERLLFKQRMVRARLTPHPRHVLSL
jgi:hypothetical protein